MGTLCNKIFLQDLKRLKVNTKNLRLSRTFKFEDGKEREFTQQELAVELGDLVGRETAFNWKTIQNAENELCDIVPSMELIVAYCEYFDISLTALFGSNDIIKCCLDYQAVSNYIGLSCDAVEVLHYHARHDNKLTSRQTENGEQYYYKNDVIEVFDWLLSDRNALRALVSFKKRIEELNERKNSNGMSSSDYSAFLRGAVGALSDALVTAFRDYDSTNFVLSREISKDEYDHLQAIKKKVAARTSSAGECKENSEPLTRDEVANIFIGDESIKNAIIDEVMQEQAARGRGRAVSSERLMLYDDYKKLIDLLDVDYLNEEKNLIAICYCSEDSKEYKNAFARLEDLRKLWNDRLIL